jgi:hypothetical protein
VQGPEFMTHPLYINTYIYTYNLLTKTKFDDEDHLCDLVVRVPGYRSRVSGFDSGATGFLSSSVSGMGSTQPREDN